jgi:hypothetical protein
VGLEIRQKCGNVLPRLLSEKIQMEDFSRIFRLLFFSWDASIYPSWWGNVFIPLILKKMSKCFDRSDKSHPLQCFVGCILTKIQDVSLVLNTLTCFPLCHKFPQSYLSTTGPSPTIRRRRPRRQDILLCKLHPMKS